MTSTLEYYEEDHEEEEAAESGRDADACHDIISCIKLDTQPLSLLDRLVVEALEELASGR